MCKSSECRKMASLLPDMDKRWHNRNLGYRIQSIDQSLPEGMSEVVSESGKTPGWDVQKDMHMLYQRFLLEEPVTKIIGSSIRVILDSKVLLKEWPLEPHIDMSLRFIGRVLPMHTELSHKSSPGDVIVVPFTASYGELKNATELAFRDTYCIFENYKVDNIELETLEDSSDDEFILSVPSGTEFRVNGSGIDLNSIFRYEGGYDILCVRCSCGASFEDGEDMKACVRCGFLQHTLCNGVEAAHVSPLFVWERCCLKTA